jgi:hypothetical protein
VQLKSCSKWKTCGLRKWISGALRILRRNGGTGGSTSSANDIETADLVTKSLIAKVSRVRSGPEYEAAVKTGIQYWLSVLADRPDLTAKKRHDKAMSALLRCQFEMTGRKTRRSMIENLKRAIHDAFTSW